MKKRAAKNQQRPKINKQEKKVTSDKYTVTSNEHTAKRFTSETNILPIKGLVVKKLDQKFLIFVGDFIWFWLVLTGVAQFWQVVGGFGSFGLVVCFITNIAKDMSQLSGVFLFLSEIL